MEARNVHRPAATVMRRQPLRGTVRGPEPHGYETFLAAIAASLREPLMPVHTTTSNVKMRYCPMAMAHLLYSWPSGVRVCPSSHYRHDRINPSTAFRLSPPRAARRAGPGSWRGAFTSRASGGSTTTKACRSPPLPFTSSNRRRSMTRVPRGRGTR
jgi:hypothetical protein